jgi:hypothetical protein
LIASSNPARGIAKNGWRFEKESTAVRRTSCLVSRRHVDRRSAAPFPTPVSAWLVESRGPVRVKTGRQRMRRVSPSLQVKWAILGPWPQAASPSLDATVLPRPGLQSSLTRSVFHRHRLYRQCGRPTCNVFARLKVHLRRIDCSRTAPMGCNRLRNTDRNLRFRRVQVCDRGQREGSERSALVENTAWRVTIVTMLKSSSGTAMTRLAAREQGWSARRSGGIRSYQKHEETVSDGY